MNYLEELISSEQEVFEKYIFENLITANIDFVQNVLKFLDCNFKNKIQFHGNVFEKTVLFENCTFDYFELSACHFKGELILANCYFKRKFTLVDCLFDSKVSFKKNVYKDGISLFDDGNEDRGYNDFASGLLVI